MVFIAFRVCVDRTLVVPRKLFCFISIKSTAHTISFSSHKFAIRDYGALAITADSAQSTVCKLINIRSRWIFIYIVLYRVSMRFFPFASKRTYISWTWIYLTFWIAISKCTQFLVNELIFVYILVWSFCWFFYGNRFWCLIRLVFALWENLSLPRICRCGTETLLLISFPCMWQPSKWLMD